MAAIIIAAIGQPFLIEGAQAQVGVSIGIALFPRDGDTVERILKAADNAMYLSKSAGRNRSTFSTEDKSFLLARLKEGVNYDQDETDH